MPPWLDCLILVLYTPKRGEMHVRMNINSKEWQDIGFKYPFSLSSRFNGSVLCHDPSLTSHDKTHYAGSPVLIV